MTGGAPLPCLRTLAPPAILLGPVAARAYGDPTAPGPDGVPRLRVIGLTGTAGKTSTAYLVESGFAAAGHTTCLVGTVETRIGAVQGGLAGTVGEVIDSVRTTPEATDLHALFATAGSYKQAGKDKLATETYQKIVKQYPDTVAGKAAEKELAK